jgi:HNH endonuclease
MTPEERFMSKVDKTDTCWLWTRPLNPSGYAYFFLNGKSVLAHRAAYALFVGRIPKGLVVDHVVDRGCVHLHCVNPAHLEPVTQRENVRRGKGAAAVAASNRRRAEARTHCLHNHELAVTGVYWETNQRGYRVRKCAECCRQRSRARREH